VLAAAASGPAWRLPLATPLGVELSRVLGGGVVPGSLLLVGGDPGVGKSTLLLQMASLIAANGTNAKPSSADDDAEDIDADEDERGPVLYVSGEESVSQVASRAARLGLPSRGVYLMAATRVEAILDAMATLNPRAVVVDSIQTVFLDEVAGAAGSVSQVRECATALLHAAKRSGAPVFLIGHVTKSGDIAGPRTLEHIVDVVLYLEARGASNPVQCGTMHVLTHARVLRLQGEALREFRLLRGVKNRYGATDEARAAPRVCSAQRSYHASYRPFSRHSGWRVLNG
jgi:DNA repair protein RadA/Sms